MEFSGLTQSLMTTVGSSFPSIVGAVAILFLGWLVALGVRFAVRRGLTYVAVNRRLQTSTGATFDVENGAAMGAFWVVLAFSLIGFFNTLNLAQVSEPLLGMVERILAYVPSILGAGVLGLIAWVAATVLRAAATRGLKATGIDERLGSEADVRPVSESLGHVVYGVILLLFLPPILGALGMQGLLEPVQNVVDKTIGILPNVAAAVVLGLVGWVVAKILRNLVTNLLASTGLDRVGHRAGLQGSLSLSALIGLLVFIFVFVPALIAAMDALQIAAISEPATRMLGTMMDAVPSLLAAAAVLVVAFFLGEFVAGLVTTLLGGIGIDRIPKRLGLPGLVPEGRTLSGLLGRLTLVFILLFAGVEAAKLLGFEKISELAAMFIAFGSQILLGTAIIGLGLWLANLAYETISRLSRPSLAPLAGLARITILALVLAMGLTAMGIAKEIVILAFALPLGAVALAFALSFGLGGRDLAGRQMEQWLSGLRGKGE